MEGVKITAIDARTTAMTTLITTIVLTKITATTIRNTNRDVSRGETIRPEGEGRATAERERRKGTAASGAA